VEELMMELLRMWLMKQILGSDSPPPGLTAAGGCGCHERELDLDDMNDLDDGRPYIWNRRDADHTC
jgi:hypothetical protein